MREYFKNFSKCVMHHPEYKVNANIFIWYSDLYKQLAHNIRSGLIEHNSLLTVVAMPLEMDNFDQIIEGMNSCDLFILFYDDDYSQPLGRPPIISQIKQFMKPVWRKSCVFKNYAEYFGNAFSIDPDKLNKKNLELIDLAKKSKKFIYTDDCGSYLEADIYNTRWTNLCLIDNFDLVPSEIAFYGKLNGVINFTGTFLSVVPFAFRYGILDHPLTLHIANNNITEVITDNKQLHQDFVQYINFNPSNKHVEEIGIGTNSSITKLYGINASFEERHVGLHLGLGGKDSGSDHLDLICKSGALFFDDTLIISDAKIVY